jgi:hypothetical protein
VSGRTTASRRTQSGPVYSTLVAPEEAA